MRMCTFTLREEAVSPVFFFGFSLLSGTLTLTSARGDEFSPSLTIPLTCRFVNTHAIAHSTIVVELMVGMRR